MMLDNECEMARRSMNETNLREIHRAVTLVLLLHNQKFRL